MLLSLTYVQALLGQSITLCVDGKLVRPVFVRLSCRACSMLGLVMTHVDRQGFGMCQALGCQGVCYRWEAHTPNQLAAAQQAAGHVADHGADGPEVFGPLNYL